MAILRNPINLALPEMENQKSISTDGNTESNEDISTVHVAMRNKQKNLSAEQKIKKFEWLVILISILLLLYFGRFLSDLTTVDEAIIKIDYALLYTKKLCHNCNDTNISCESHINFLKTNMKNISTCYQINDGTKKNYVMEYTNLIQYKILLGLPNDDLDFYNFEEYRELIKLSELNLDKIKDEIQIDIYGKKIYCIKGYGKNKGHCSYVNYEILLKLALLFVFMILFTMYKKL